MTVRHEYIEQYEKLHQSDDSYGTSSRKIIDEVSQMIRHLKPATVLDYGCGKGVLLNALKDRFPGITFHGYDPAIRGIDTLPVERADLIINTDVLEHIPEKLLPDVIEQMAGISRNVYFNLHHAPSKAILPNGENAHCTVKPPEWYHALLRQHFDIVVPLGGRKKHWSVALTFDIPTDVRDQYNRIVRTAKRRAWWKKLVRKLFR